MADMSGGKQDWLSERLRENFWRIWQELNQADTPKDYFNLEGGSVEQVRDMRLRFHHCANYAAALTILQERLVPSEQKGIPPQGRNGGVEGQGNLHILELGCGGGALTFAFARVMPSGWQLLAADYSEQLIDYAQKVRRAENLRFQRVEINNLDIGFLNDVDGVMFLEVIEHLPQKVVRNLLCHLYQGLRPGGLVIISTLDRSPFRRGFSGYPPHWIEYRYETLSGFLTDKSNNPFEVLKIFRLGSEKIVRAAVRAEEMGGYFVNRLNGLVKRFAKKYAGFNFCQERLGAVFFRLYSRIPFKMDFGIEGYVNELYFINEGETDDKSSFSLVAVLRKEGK